MSHGVNRPGHGSYGGSQSNANANANANAIGDNGGVLPAGPSYYPQPIPSGSKAIGNANANANAQANAAANANSGSSVHISPGRYPTADYPSKGVGQLEIIPINQRPIPTPSTPIIIHPKHPPSHPLPQSQGQDIVIPLVIVDDTSPPQGPSYQHPPSPPYYHRPHYHHHNKPKPQPIEIIVIEEAAPGQGDALRSRMIKYQSSCDHRCVNRYNRAYIAMH